MIQGVFRADGSSRFGKNNKYGYFLHFRRMGHDGREIHEATQEST